VVAAGERFEFGGFTLDRKNWTLLGPDGAPVALTPKAFDALVCFLERPGEVIDRATLIDVLWPNTVVEENNLRQVIAALRRSIGSELIRTVPRRGYQFAADVRVLPEDAATETKPMGHVRADTGTWRGPRLAQAAAVVATLLIAAIASFWYRSAGLSDTGTPQPRLAVLPFTDASPGGDIEYVADAIAIELLTTLSLIDGLEVRGSTSSFYFKDHPADLPTIRDLLGVDYVLEGDVQSVDDRVRISVRLTNADTGAQVWSEAYDRIVDDLFVLQDEIARTTAQALEITLGIGTLGKRLGTTRNAEAFFEFVDADRILRQGIRFSPATVREAIPHLERAVTLDEDFALAWFELYWQSRFLDILAAEAGGRVPGALERAEFALGRVEELTPNLPELVLSKLETSADAHDIARAMEQLLVEATNTSYPPWILSLVEARYLRFTGRLRESTVAAERARVLDPLNQAVVGLLAEGYSAEGRHRDALDVIDESVRLYGSTPGIEGTAFVIALQQGDREEIARRAEAMQNLPTGIIREVLANGFDDAESALSALREFVAAPDPSMILWPTLLAPWAAYFGDDDLALEMYGHEVPFATGNTISRPIFAGMRRLPGFRDLVRDIGLLSYWRESGNWPDYCRPLELEDFECF
jgi:TolB-like protein/DNA-binding winged helix-turn-helix (wHTH) protein/tetratricopeptide (TPR) repeat protein